jgi:aspartyl-tRNA(Asn)/glutamyl-tRNA(Gln) amidotransferase subunit B
MTDYEPVIGLEVHAQLLTHTKLFCSCSVAFGQGANSNVCPVCLGWPGALPVTNAEAVRLAVRAALALDCEIHHTSIFARKQYFYPDLPKGYQISQFEEPLATHGHLDVELDGETVRAGITRIHMEEDAGKNVHGVGGNSVVDLNRAGTPLIEIVGEPDLRSSAQAAGYLRALRDVLVAIGINDGNLEEGSFRCDANVSIRPRGSDVLGTRVELKNINSFRFVQKAIDGEVARQTAILDVGGSIEQETRGYDAEKNSTTSLRSKADAHDYRYFPDPDLPPLRIAPELVEGERACLPELPRARRARYVEKLGISAGNAATLVAHPRVAEYFEAVHERFPDAPKAANWITTEVLRGVKTHGLEAEFPVRAEQLAQLLDLIEQGAISGKQAKDVYAAVEGTDRWPKDVVAERGMRVVSDDDTLLAFCREVLAGNSKGVDQYKAGKKGTLGFFVGQVMKKTAGSADPKRVNELLRKLLEE